MLEDNVVGVRRIFITCLYMLSCNIQDILKTNKNEAHENKFVKKSLVLVLSLINNWST